MAECNLHVGRMDDRKVVWLQASSAGGICKHEGGLGDSGIAWVACSPRCRLRPCPPQATQHPALLAASSRPVSRGSPGTPE